MESLRREKFKRGKNYFRFYMTTPQLDPIAGMSFYNVTDECCKIVGLHFSDDENYLRGAIIAQLQEWKCGISWLNGLKLWAIDFRADNDNHINYDDASLQVAFLRTALTLNKWTPPAPKEPELTLEERVTAIEKRLKRLDANYGCWPAGTVLPLK